MILLAQWIIGTCCLAFLVLLLCVLIGGGAKAAAEAATLEIPASCLLVETADIEPPHTEHTAAQLKLIYLELERLLVENHPPAMADTICRSMAESLLQGWPPDVAILQATHRPGVGKCPCPTCRNLISPYP